MKTEIFKAKTPSLEITYEQTGPESGEPIILLHGFPYDVRQYDKLRDLLASDNKRIIVPHIRGFGETNYLSKKIMRSGQQAAIGKDVIDLMDALKIKKATLMGFDWGATASCVAAAIWPERVNGLVSAGGYRIVDRAKLAVIAPEAEEIHQYWYRWYFNCEMGVRGLEQKRKELGKKCWEMWSPTWNFADSYYNKTAESFENPDFVETVIHSYRHRYAQVDGDLAYEELEQKLAKKPKISVPTIVLHGEDDKVQPVKNSLPHKKQFTSSYERRVLPGVGHCPPAENPQSVSDAIQDVINRKVG